MCTCGGGVSGSGPPPSRWSPPRPPRTWCGRSISSSTPPPTAARSRFSLGPREHTPVRPRRLVRRSITAEVLAAELNRIVATRGAAPAVLRLDNGPEMIGAALAEWAGTRTGMLFIPPGEPWKNPFIESFNSRLPRRVPQHQPVLVPDPRPRHQRREDRVQPRRATLIPGLPQPSQIRCGLHPMIGLSYDLDRSIGSCQAEAPLQQGSRPGNQVRLQWPTSNGSTPPGSGPPP